MTNEVEIRNAIITDAIITVEDRGLLSGWVYLDYGGTSQGFGGVSLYLPKNFKNHEMLSCAGHWIYRIMQVADVERWDKLKGKTVRVRTSWTDVKAIGHIVKDDWFEPGVDFKWGEK